MDFSPAAMRARFATLRAEIDAIEEVSQPKRAARDAVVSKARESETKMNAEIADLEAGLFDKKQELALIARALNGKTGEPVETPAEAEPEAVTE